MSMLWIRESSPPPAQGRFYREAMIITLGGNIVLAVSKGIIAAISGSVALFADAANSISDVVYSILLVLGLWMAQKPPDISHPQGHSRFEPLVGMVVTISMGVAGFEAARVAVLRFMEGGRAVLPGMPALILLVSALIKTVMYLRIRWISQRLSSPTLATTAQDNLTDVLTSIAAFLGALGSYYIHPLLDSIGGMAVALWIFRAVYRAARENLGFLTGAGADQQLREALVNAAAEIPGVQRVHHLMSEYSGPRLIVDVHINVSGSMSLTKAHAIADAVTDRLEEFDEVDRAYVHVEPEGYD